MFKTLRLWTFLWSFIYVLLVIFVIFYGLNLGLCWGSWHGKGVSTESQENTTAIGKGLYVLLIGGFLEMDFMVVRLLILDPLVYFSVFTADWFKHCFSAIKKGVKMTFSSILHKLPMLFIFGGFGWGSELIFGGLGGDGVEELGFMGGGGGVADEGGWVFVFFLVEVHYR